ncbi:hypothetical protein K490DRAFT_53950 [Saccharata proteae CBS 121410]|uniref:Uncharacterized protein n=1 Tax=Saccharata proteae CBS 121410 TaxID=1314787 RepID=A0A9P4M2M3_9PEZI|nr:hypothetical protein K490DRAFT_53950 [Saccharata proteae CBS 121410]
MHQMCYESALQDIRSTQDAMELLRRHAAQSKNTYDSFLNLLQRCVQNKNSGSLSLRGSIQLAKKADKMKKYRGDLQSYRSGISRAIDVLNMEKIEEILSEIRKGEQKISGEPADLKREELSRLYEDCAAAMTSKVDFEQRWGDANVDGNTIAARVVGMENPSGKIRQTYSKTTAGDDAIITEGIVSTGFMATIMDKSAKIRETENRKR